MEELGGEGFGLDKVTWQKLEVSKRAQIPRSSSSPCILFVT